MLIGLIALLVILSLTMICAAQLKTVYLYYENHKPQEYIYSGLQLPPRITRSVYDTSTAWRVCCRRKISSRKSPKRSDLTLK